VTTDYRRVLSEILIGRLGNTAISTVFPGYTFDSPLGFIMDPPTPPVPVPPGLTHKTYLPLIGRTEDTLICP
ncbi:MAG: hypothetical protein HGB05_19450, partial [Chloroflexi bacterium]|nr:hypothetical protein [Chloroflexota bacterium]